jgi:hypothetical protein
MPSLDDLDKIIPAFDKLLQEFLNDPILTTNKFSLLALLWLVTYIGKKTVDNFPAIYSQITLWRISLFSDWSF